MAAPLPTPEDLIVMKSVPHRPHDLADIEGIVDAHPNLDWQRIRYWVQAFAERLDRSEIVASLDRFGNHTRPQSS